MTMLSVPYHLDEYLPDFRLPWRGHTETVMEELPDSDSWSRMAVLHEAVAARVADEVRAGRTPTVLSGDCMVALGTAAGVQRAGVDASVVWFDAHGDVQTMETSASGYAGGIPLRVLAGYRPDPAMDRLGLRTIPEARLLLVDGRDLDPPEAEYLRTSAVRHSGVADLGAGDLPGGPLLLHVDLDVIDPDEVPGMLFPTPGGPSRGTVVEAVHRVLDTGRVEAVSVGCTWRPDREEDLPGGVRAKLLAALLRR
ncbi:arginase family protein [Nocardiopsis sp. NRRL B-16309]|uniref:arginase family protein n=1 Tax=Nocardiopsis sp. NRRL B-16309 TaxID=1519494 RepID=UPI0006C426DD|nr:arginase family protein [Nocardiopsis sp. NRRL B-16309]KOX17534.1 arginase [Nocardiopsis sp. NRRL B-16309]